MIKRFPHYHQPDAKDCGPTCLKIVSKHFGRDLNLSFIRQVSETNRGGSSLLGLNYAAEELGIKSLGVKINLEKLNKAPLPCILHWNKNHYVVLYKIKNNEYFVSDPAHGLLKYSEKEFLNNWIGNKDNNRNIEGTVLLLETTSSFFEGDFPEEKSNLSISFALKYILKYKKFIWQLVFGLLAGSLLQLIFPFLTQAVVDIGIENQDLNFIYLILLAQLLLFIGRTSIEIIRSWILLHLSVRINISLLSDFFIKLMKLPIAFFDTRTTGDILQRINDHERIERILTNSSLRVLFSLMTLLVFGIILVYYNLEIFLTFIFGSILYFGWILLFLRRRADLDYKRFSKVSEEQSQVIELINGMQEIKLNNAEKQMRWNWEDLQVKLFKIAMDGLKLEQWQNVGSNSINELKNIVITILSAKLVIDGEITLGMMLAISYIVGQLNAPISQLMNFIRELQDAKLSLDRLSEIHNKEDEEENSNKLLHDIGDDSDLVVENLTFRYPGSDMEVLKDMNLKIPSKKITAIVGVSGSGKTTLMKLLLKFYNLNNGKIYVGEDNLEDIYQQAWRKHTGVVMQEGYLFNNTIAKNIAIGNDLINMEKLEHAVNVANIKDYIESLPMGYETKIGMNGEGLSTGQKQRILIARAVYKRPSFLFFDEATSALDANNESQIMNNLNLFFKNRTVVIIAHRLSTVKNADQIVVIDEGKIAEIGNHHELSKMKGKYYHLVKNQLELGN
jgi:ATP-binding cassette, subfamily B, bacterial